ncbi:MAG: STAS domain-containing protein [Acidobacteria bacterium]|nr:STAS domain-containing protein [Acidobacteriota bacterium]
MSKDLELNIVRNGACSVIEIQGDIDLKTSPQVRAAILDLFEKRGQERVILDLKGVNYIDSSGVASLVEGLQQAKKHKARFILSCLNQAPRHVLDLTRLTSVFEITQTVDEALK